MKKGVEHRNPYEFSKAKCYNPCNITAYYQFLSDPVRYKRPLTGSKPVNSRIKSVPGPSPVSVISTNPVWIRNLLKETQRAQNTNLWSSEIRELTHNPQPLQEISGHKWVLQVPCMFTQCSWRSLEAPLWIPLLTPSQLPGIGRRDRPLPRPGHPNPGIERVERRGPEVCSSGGSPANRRRK